MQHGRRPQQNRRRYRKKVLEHPQNMYLYEELLGKTVIELKEILEVLTQQQTQLDQKDNQ